MWKQLRNIAMYLGLVSCLWLVGSPTGYSQATYTMTQEQFNELNQTFNNLSNNNDKLKDELAMQQTELNQVKAQLEKSNTTLNQSSNQTIQLQNQLEASKQELKQAIVSSEKTIDLLNTANQSLEKLEKRRQSTDRQNRILKYLLIGVSVYAWSK